MKATTTILALATLCFLGACREGGESQGVGSPQAAVVEWLDSVDRGDFEQAAEMGPPTSSSEEKKELADKMEERFEGLRRDESSPFAMSGIESSSAEALVRLKGPGGETRSVRLSLELHDGKWHVTPEEPSDGE